MNYSKNCKMAFIAIGIWCVSVAIGAVRMVQPQQQAPQPPSVAEASLAVSSAIDQDITLLYETAQNPHVTTIVKPRSTVTIRYKNPSMVQYSIADGKRLFVIAPADLARGSVVITMPPDQPQAQPPIQAPSVPQIQQRPQMVASPGAPVPGAPAPGAPVPGASAQGAVRAVPSELVAGPGAPVFEQQSR